MYRKNVVLSNLTGADVEQIEEVILACDKAGLKPDFSGAIDED